MNYAELIQVIGLSALLSLAAFVSLMRFGRVLLAVIQALLPPRYLKSRGVRRRSPAKSVPHEPV
jgi:cellulose biosynthesis operon protein BcsF/YhjT